MATPGVRRMARTQAPGDNTRSDAMTRETMDRIDDWVMTWGVSAAAVVGLIAILELTFRG